MKYTLKLQLQGKAINIIVPYSVIGNNTALNTSRYNNPLVNTTNIDEFNEDIRMQINFLQDQIINDQNIFGSLAFMCINHIEKFNRIIITDLFAYLDNTMIIVDSTNGIFHNLINSEEDGINLRKTFQHGIVEDLYNYIWVPKPSLNRSQETVLIPLKDLNR